MRVDPVTVQRIKDTIDLKALAGRYLTFRGDKALCPFHKERTPSFHVNREKQFFKCFGCGEGGDAIRFLMLAEGWDFPRAVSELAREAGIGLAQQGTERKPKNAFEQREGNGGHSRLIPEHLEPVEPKPDRERLKRFLEQAQLNLWERPEIQERWLAKRGIPLATAKTWGVGFLEETTFPEWPTWRIKNAWAFPICNRGGEVLAVKLHREQPFTGPKCLWCPFGTELDPKTGKLRHGFNTLWPAPERFFDLEDERAGIMEHCGGLSRAEAEKFSGWRDTTFYMCPGELKALAEIATGAAATSVTAGETYRWTLGMITRLRAYRVVVVFDDDPAGHRFRDATLAALVGHVADLRAITYGRAET